MIKLVLFDWGDVCCLYNLDVFNTFLKNKGYDQKIADAHFKELKSQFDRTEISEETFWNELSKKLRFKEHWSVLASENKKNLVVNWSLLDFIRGLKKKVPIALLSNMDKTSIAAIKNEVNLPDYFEKAYFSSEHGMGKLEKPIVDKILKEFKVKPEEILFVDDFPGNIEKAKRIGMQTILFIGADDLKSRLKEFKVM